VVREKKAAGCAYFDSTAAQGGHGSSAIWAAATPPLVGPDLVHMTSAGYDVLASELATALGLRPASGG
jgi:lysophospholipase L1-like esterase